MGGNGNDNRRFHTVLALTFCDPTNQILIGLATGRQCQSCAEMTITVPSPSHSRLLSLFPPIPSPTRHVSARHGVAHDDNSVTDGMSVLTMKS